MSIDEFRGDNFFLSNFYNIGFHFAGIDFRSSECFFQAMKTTDLTIQKNIARMKPAEAKRAGQGVNLRRDWGATRLLFMEMAIRLKFSNENVKQRLINTGDEELIEGNDWGDKFWGADRETGEGENNLGKILMSFREECKKEAAILMMLS